MLARFDDAIGRVGLAKAAHDLLRTLGATLDVRGERLRPGGALVLANHPGAYDALAIMAALERDDVAFIAADRAFLRALPHLQEHLFFAGPRGLRQAIEWLDLGKVVVQFGAGSIEPDPRFAENGTVLGEWNGGTGMLAERAARANASVVPCFVSGVHSPRAKRLFVVRLAERHGITTIGPLVQATLPGFRDVVVDVRLGKPLDPAALLRQVDHQARTELARAALMLLKS